MCCAGWALRQSNMDTNEGRCDLHYSDCTPLTLNLIVEYVWRVIVHSPRTSAESDEASKNSSEAGYRVWGAEYWGCLQALRQPIFRSGLLEGRRFKAVRQYSCAWHGDTGSNRISDAFWWNNTSCIKSMCNHAEFWFLVKLETGIAGVRYQVLWWPLQWVQWFQEIYIQSASQSAGISCYDQHSANSLDACFKISINFTFIFTDWFSSVR